MIQKNEVMYYNEGMLRILYRWKFFGKMDSHGGMLFYGVWNQRECGFGGKMENKFLTNKSGTQRCVLKWAIILPTLNLRFFAEEPNFVGLCVKSHAPYSAILSL